MSVYPAGLVIRNRRCAVIGGGPIAEGKVRALLEAGGAVTVISPRLTPALDEWAQAERLRHLARRYRPGDLAGVWLAIAATDDRQTNRQVWQEAEERGILINVVDDPPHCNFIAPAVVRRGDLTIAISTGGKAPALAARLRQQLEQTIGAEYAPFLELAGSVRKGLAARWPAAEQRRTLWYRLVDSDILELLRRGDEPAARRRAAEITGVVPAWNGGATESDGG